MWTWRACEQLCFYAHRKGWKGTEGTFKPFYQHFFLFKRSNVPTKISHSRFTLILFFFILYIYISILKHVRTFPSDLYTFCPTYLLLSTISSFLWFLLFFSYIFFLFFFLIMFMSINTICSFSSFFCIFKLGKNIEREYVVFLSSFYLLFSFVYNQIVFNENYDTTL